MYYMRDNFQRRAVPNAPIPDVINNYASDDVALKELSNHSWFKILVAYMNRYPYDLRDEKKWPILPDGVDRALAGQKFYNQNLRVQYINDVTSQLMNDDWFARSEDALRKAADGKNFAHVQLLYPQTLDDSSSNITPYHMRMKILERQLQDDTYQIAGHTLRFIWNPSVPYISIKGSRGGVKYQTNDIKEKVVGHKLSKQIVVEGGCDPDVLYWIIDDGITTGGTLRNYYDYIESEVGRSF